MRMNSRNSKGWAAAAAAAGLSYLGHNLDRLHMATVMQCVHVDISREPATTRCIHLKQQLSQVSQLLCSGQRALQQLAEALGPVMLHNSMPCGPSYWVVALC